MKRIISFLVLVLIAVLFVGCDTTPSDEPNQGFDTNKVTFLSAYNEAQELGFEGTLEEFIALISGKDGTDGFSAYEIAVKNGYTGTEAEWLASLAGAKGTDGTNGFSAYEIAVKNSYTGTEAEWLASLVGAQGEKGDKGDTGAQGIGIKSVSFDENGNLLITFTDNSTQTVEMPEKEEHVHSFGEWVSFSANAFVYCEERLFYHICSECSFAEWKKGGDHNFETVTTPPTCQAGGYDTKTCSVCGKAEKLNETPIADHTWKTDYSYDQLFHWIGCEYCDAKDSNAEHISDDSGCCTVCGFANEALFYWDDVTFIFQMSNNTSNDQLSSGSARYLAGEQKALKPYEEDTIDEMIDERNEEAMEYANVSDIEYLYWDNTSEYGWSNASLVIIKETSSHDTTGLPDVYVNFVYDMVACSLQGCFANLYGTVRGMKNNYFPFNDFRDAVDEGEFDEVEMGDGYMYEYMTTLTLSKHKMYVLASDYFTDLVRAFYVIPVNIKLLEQVGMEVTGDLVGNGDGFNVEDFYEEVKRGEWTYNKLAQYSAAIYKDNQNPGRKDVSDTIGFALAESGLAGSGMIYTTSCTIINRNWSSKIRDYEYSYPSENNQLYDIVDQITLLFGKTGVLAVTDEDASSNGAASNESLIKKRFSQDQVLFGGIILVGSLEDEDYQSMRKTKGFGVVPVPLYKDNTGDKYLTQIHNVGRAGAISVKTQKFEQLTAFLDYQSTHSTEILDEYYDIELQYNVAGGSKGTIYMLQYIRENVRTAFDKTFEDAIGEFYGKNKERWHTKLYTSGYNMDIRGIYQSLYNSKENDLKNLIKQYDVLPD